MPDGRLNQAKMVQLPCKSTFRRFEPIEEKRDKCPFVLVIARGVHTHPIPLPTKTPRVIRDEVQQLLCTLDEDLPDLTSRRFLRHSSLKSYLVLKYPTLLNPTLADLHISLANRAHLQCCIDVVKNECFPLGTGWEGKVYNLFYNLSLAF